MEITFSTMTYFQVVNSVCKKWNIERPFVTYFRSCELGVLQPTVGQGNQKLFKGGHGRGRTGSFFFSLSNIVDESGARKYEDEKWY